jgi:3-hydroxymyristoyl/3-hydroxydecanoyl-(acyl carrier protein) dehydratase
VVLEFAIPPESDYFDDHFPILRVLPAVAQFELAIRFASRYFGTSIDVEKARRLKFSSLVRPNTPLRLELSKAEDSKNISFSFTSPDGETVYSSGSFVFGDRA